VWKISGIASDVLRPRSRTNGIRARPRFESMLRGRASRFLGRPMHRKGPATRRTFAQVCCGEFRDRRRPGTSWCTHGDNRQPRHSGLRFTRKPVADLTPLSAVHNALSAFLREQDGPVSSSTTGKARPARWGYRVRKRICLPRRWTPNNGSSVRRNLRIVSS